MGGNRNMTAYCSLTYLFSFTAKELGLSEDASPAETKLPQRFLWRELLILLQPIQVLFIMIAKLACLKNLN